MQWSVEFRIMKYLVNTYNAAISLVVLFLSHICDNEGMGLSSLVGELSKSKGSL